MGLSLFLSGISKTLPPTRPLLQRLFSSQSPYGPYLYLEDKVLKVIYYGSSSNKFGRVVDTRLFDPRKEETITFPNEEHFSESLASFPIGTSRGWLATNGPVYGPEEEETYQTDMHLTNKSYNREYVTPYTRLASLPVPDPSSTECVVNVSLSSSFHEDDEDCIMAIKFFGPHFSFCRPALGEDDEWTDVYLPESHYDNSSMVYSNRHRMFYMMTRGNQYLAAWDLHTYHCPYHVPPNSFKNSWLTPLIRSNQPKFSESLTQMMLSCFTTHYLTESPSLDCDFFHVTGYFQTSHAEEEELVSYRLTYNAKRFTVFKISNTDMSYTEDIGDLCIFVGQNEAFCLSAAMYPGLRPNSIYFVGLGSVPNAGVYDIATLTIHHFPFNRVDSLLF